MKTKSNLAALALLAVLLAGCGEQSLSSSALLSSSPDSSSSLAASSSLASDSSSSASQLQEQKADYSNLPYLKNVSDLKKTDWKGKWIWADKNPKDSYYAFRKTFSLASLTGKAKLSIAVDSKFSLWVNGNLTIVDGGVKRGESEFDSFYQVFDISKNLKVGTNTLAFEVNYFGRSGNSSIDSTHGGLLFDLDLGTSFVSSDAQVRFKRLTSYKNESSLKGDYPGYPQSSFLAEHDIYFDAREEDENFMKSDYDASSWSQASIIGTPGYLPFGELYLTSVPAFDFSDEISLMSGNESLLGKKLEENKTLTFALDGNQQFLPYFKISAAAGQRITFYTNSLVTQSIASFKDDYIAKDGEQTYNQLYWRSGYQFIMEVPAGVTLLEIGYKKTGYHAEKAGSFISDDSSLNTLWSKAYNTLKICMRDNYMDCPERERSPYTGDSANQIGETLYALNEDGWKLAQKTLLALPGWVKNDHIIPSRFPSATTNEIPMQNLAFLVTSCDYYLYTGDESTISKVFEIFVDYLKLWNLNADGSVEYRSGSFPWVDWGEGYDSEVMENGWYYYALTKIHELGKTAGIIKAEDDSFFAEREAKIKTGFAKFKKNGAFTSSDSGNVFDDRANALAVLSGLAEKEDYAKITEILNTVKQASPYMEKYVLEALCQMGECAAAKTRMLSRYQDMINYEADTLWEEWKAADGTINHGWSGGPLTVMSKYFAGIKPTSKGYAAYEIKPSACLNSLNAAVPTPLGTIDFQMEKGASGTTIAVKGLPSAGKLVLSPTFGSSVNVDGKAIAAEKDSDGNLLVDLSSLTETITVS